MEKTNETMIQFFEWYLNPDCSHWNKATNEANYLSHIGINYVWLPPAYKGANGILDTGYAVYDLYDLGEFNQKGEEKTKYGSKEEYINAINALKNNGIKVLADIVFNASNALISLPSYLAIIAHFSISGIAPQTISIKSSSEFTASKICL